MYHEIFYFINEIAFNYNNIIYVTFILLLFATLCNHMNYIKLLHLSFADAIIMSVKNWTYLHSK
jgi:hypothetical protein